MAHFARPPREDQHPLDIRVLQRLDQHAFADHSGRAGEDYVKLHSSLVFLSLAATSHTKSLSSNSNPRRWMASNKSSSSAMKSATMLSSLTHSTSSGEKPNA